MTMQIFVWTPSGVGNWAVLVVSDSIETAWDLANAVVEASKDTHGRLPYEYKGWGDPAIYHLEIADVGQVITLEIG